MLPQQIGVSIEEFYTIIGELEVVRRKLNQQIQEMSNEITRLREENGKLVKSDSNE